MAKIIGNKTFLIAPEKSDKSGKETVSEENEDNYQSNFNHVESENDSKINNSDNDDLIKGSYSDNTLSGSEDGDLIFLESYWKTHEFNNAAQKLAQFLTQKIINAPEVVDLILEYLELCLVQKLTNSQKHRKSFLLYFAEKEPELATYFELIDIIEIELLETNEEIKSSVLYNFKKLARNLREIFAKRPQSLSLEKFTFLVNKRASNSFSSQEFRHIVELLELNSELIKQTVESKKFTGFQCNPELQRYKIYTQLLSQSFAHLIFTEEYLHSAASPIYSNNDILTVIRVFQGSVICIEGELSNANNNLGLKNANRFELNVGDYHVLEIGTNYQIINQNSTSSTIIKICYVGDIYQQKPDLYENYDTGIECTNIFCT